MRWFIGILIALNLGILAWGWMGDDEQPEGDLAPPGVGTIRLVGEPPAVPEPVAVPIPMPPRVDGVMPAQAEVPRLGGDAATAAASMPAASTAQPIDDDEPPVSSGSRVTPAPAASPKRAAGSPAIVVDAKPAISKPEPAFVPEPEVLLGGRTSKQCQRIGPFPDAASAKTTRSTLAKYGTVTSEQTSGQVPTGYWVLVPPQSSRDAALTVADRLKANGIKDFWIVSKGAAKHGISLGVFSQKANADRFAATARAKGFNVEIRVKTKAGTQTWLNYQGSRVIRSTDIPKADGVKIIAKGCP